MAALPTGEANRAQAAAAHRCGNRDNGVAQIHFAELSWTASARRAIARTGSAAMAFASSFMPARAPVSVPLRPAPAMWPAWKRRRGRRWHIGGNHYYRTRRADADALAA